MSTQAEHAGQGAAPTEEELRAAYEAELSRIKSVDMVLQAAASLLNIGAHRLGLTGAPQDAGAERQLDLEQVRDAIDAVRGLLPVIERSAPDELRPLRDALAQLQMAYTRAAQAASTTQAPVAGQSAAAAGSAAPAAPAPPAGSAAPAEPAPPAGSAAPAEPAPPAAPAHPVPGTPPTAEPGDKPGPGPAESSGRLWVPGR